MSHRYTIESETPIELMDLLDAVSLILEPDQTHRPSTDSLMMGMWSDRLVKLRHSRLGVTVEIE